MIQMRKKYEMLNKKYRYDRERPLGNVCDVVVVAVVAKMMVVLVMVVAFFFLCLR